MRKIKIPYYHKHRWMPARWMDKFTGMDLGADPMQRWALRRMIESRKMYRGIVGLPYDKTSYDFLYNN